MEATTYETAALIDRGAEDYMLETAILKVFSTEALWQGVYETLQIHGGQGYFTDEPYERMMRDARINTIGEGANEVLKAFIALVGMRDVGEGFKATLDGLKSPVAVRADPLAVRPRAVRAAGQAAARSRSPRPSSGPTPTPWRAASRRFAWAVERVLVKHREAILDRQYVQERIADAAIALMTASCTLARLDRDSPRSRHRGRNAPPASSTSGWPTDGSTRPSATSTTTTTATTAADAAAQSADAASRRAGRPLREAVRRNPGPERFIVDEWRRRRSCRPGEPIRAAAFFVKHCGRPEPS